MIPKCTAGTNTRGDPYIPCRTRARFALPTGFYYCTPCFWMMVDIGAELGYVECLWNPAEWMIEFDQWNLPFIELPEGWR